MAKKNYIKITFESETSTNFVMDSTCTQAQLVMALLGLASKVSKEDALSVGAAMEYFYESLNKEDNKKDKK